MLLGFGRSFAKKMEEISILVRCLSVLVAFLETKVFCPVSEKDIARQGPNCEQALKGVLCHELGPGQNRSSALAYTGSCSPV